MPSSTAARDLLHNVVDEASFRSWDVAPIHGDLTVEYGEQLARARQRSGHDEAAITGKATIGGTSVAVVVSEFGFMAGSIGRPTGDRISAAIRRATAERLPLLTFTASGGTRIQEGTSAFLAMVDLVRALEAHKAAGLPYIVYLGHPTTGGVLASWASLGDLLLAEPGALVGFLGPRVYRALKNADFPPRVQTAENLHAQGVVDAIVPPDCLRETLTNLFDHLASLSPAALGATTPVETFADLDAWQCIQETRRDDRPGVRELLKHGATSTFWLYDPSDDFDDALIVVITAFGGTSCVLVGEDRASARKGANLGPRALRRARRAVLIAKRLALPLVTVIDTPGAELSVAAEEQGLAGLIAGCISDLITLNVPSVSILLGQGTGGGALALLPAGRVIAAENAWLAPLPPEGASAILYRSPDHAAAQARVQGIRARDLLESGIVHAVVGESPPAHLDPVGFSQRVAAECGRQLRSFEGSETSDRSTRTHALGRESEGTRHAW